MKCQEKVAVLKKLSTINLPVIAVNNILAYGSNNSRGNTRLLIVKRTDATNTKRQL